MDLRARQWAFTIIHRNSHSAAEYYKIPGDSVIELGAKVVCASACLRASVCASLCTHRRRSSFDSGRICRMLAHVDAKNQIRFVQGKTKARHCNLTRPCRTGGPLSPPPTSIRRQKRVPPPRRRRSREPLRPAPQPPFLASTPRAASGRDRRCVPVPLLASRRIRLIVPAVCASRDGPCRSRAMHAQGRKGACPPGSIREGGPGCVFLATGCVNAQCKIGAG